MNSKFEIRLLLGMLVVAAASCSQMQSFELSGRIDGLQVGDTLRFERILLPEWNREPAFDVVVGEPDRFEYRGRQEHDQYYMMTYRPKVGKAASGDRGGKPLLVTSGDRITLSGTTDEIYYSAIGGGIYDDPAFAELRTVEDSLGRIRGRYLQISPKALEQGDTVRSREWGEKFNLFYNDNPGAARRRALKKTYEEARPQGTLDLLVDRISAVSYLPLDESRAFYETLSEELKTSYYGRLYADCLEKMEGLADGKPAPEFTLVTTEGKSIANADFAGGYLLFYHWGLCPGSIYIDAQVCDLYETYRARGLRVVGLTESIDVIRRVYESLPADVKTPSAGVKDMRPVLAGMLVHDWPEVELETDRPENGRILESYAIKGWPTFVLIAPDGTIAARGFTDAFFKAKKSLNEALGAAHPE